MKTIIVPVDFSETSKNAARYAAGMLKGQYGIRIILYHVYEKPDHATSLQEALERLKTELNDAGAIKIETLAEEGDHFVENLERFARHQDAHLIVIGITAKTNEEQYFLGGNALKLIETRVCPILTIPPNASFGGIQRAVLTSELKNVSQTVPVIPIKTILEILHPALYILNVNDEHYVSLSEEYETEKKKLADMFSEYQPEFSFIGMSDFHDALNAYISDNKIDLIISVPRRHTFLEHLFQQGNTRKMVYQTHIPVLAVHQ